jgi:hypothetical protein
MLSSSVCLFVFSVVRLYALIHILTGRNHITTIPISAAETTTPNDIYDKGALLKFSHSHWTDCTIRRQILLYLKMKKDLRYVIFHSRQPHSIEAKRWPTSVPHPQIIGCLMPEPAIRYRLLIWFYLNRIILTNMRISFQNCLVDF